MGFNYDEFCEKILRINEKIRYVGVYHKGEFHSKMQKGLKSLLSEAEIKNSAVEAVKRWETRLSMASKLGKAVYSLTKYEKVNRMTFPINEDGLILVSVETRLDPNSIVEKIIEIRDRAFS